MIGFKDLFKENGVGYGILRDGDNLLKLTTFAVIKGGVFFFFLV